MRTGSDQRNRQHASDVRRKRREHTAWRARVGVRWRQLEQRRRQVQAGERLARAVIQASGVALAQGVMEQLDSGRARVVRRPVSRGWAKAIQRVSGRRSTWRGGGRRKR